MAEQNGDFWRYLVRYRIARAPQHGVWELRYEQDDHGYSWKVEHVSTGLFLCGRGTGKTQPHFWGPEHLCCEFNTWERAVASLEAMLIKQGILRIDDRGNLRRQWSEIKDVE